MLLRNPDAKFTLVDVSEEMIKQAKKNIGERNNVDFIVENFENYNMQNKIDFFFSSRSIEYVPDKRKAVRNIHRVLKLGSEGLIITKNPNSLGRILSRFIGKKPDLAHTEQIIAQDLVNLLKEFEFKKIKVYPCIVSALPVIRLFWLNRFIWKKIYKKENSRVLGIFCESFLIKFKK